MDTQAIGITTALPFSDPLQETSAPGAGFADESAMKSYYLQMACRCCPETIGRGDEAMLERLLKRLRKRRILLDLMCREWYRGYGFLQTECLSLLVEAELTVEKKRGIVRMLYGQFSFVQQMVQEQFFLQEEVLHCRREREDVEWLLEHLNGGGIVPAENPEDFPIRADEGVSVPDAVSAPEGSGRISEESEGDSVAEDSSED